MKEEHIVVSLMSSQTSKIFPQISFFPPLHEYVFFYLQIFFPLVLVSSSTGDKYKNF